MIPSGPAAAAKSLRSCPTLCDPIDSSSPGSPVPGILQARILEWVAISFSSAWKVKSESEVAQSCSTLSDPMDCSLPGSSVHGIFQARVLEGVRVWIYLWWGGQHSTHYTSHSTICIGNRGWTEYSRREKCGSLIGNMTLDEYWRLNWSLLAWDRYHDVRGRGMPCLRR